VLQVAVIDPLKGWLHYEAVFPPQLAVFIYVQAAVLSLAGPSFPLKVSNLQEGVVIF
jgi:hypothetical protein